MLEAVSVTKSFDGKTVIDGFSYRFEKDGRYCLMGPSGCGKTTLLSLLMGLIKPDSGEIRGLSGLKLAAVFQEDRLLEQMTAHGNVRLVSSAPDAEIDALMASLGIGSESLSQPVGEFSGGMKRRVALCRALMSDHDALFLDEPYKGLDADTRDDVMSIVAQRTKGKLVLLVTHDPMEAEGYEIIHMG